MSSRQRAMVSKSCGLRPGWLDDGQHRPEQRQAVHGRAGQQRPQAGEVRLDGQLEDVQRPAALGAHRPRAELLGEPALSRSRSSELRASIGSWTSST